MKSYWMYLYYWLIRQLAFVGSGWSVYTLIHLWNHTYPYPPLLINLTVGALISIIPISIWRYYYQYDETFFDNIEDQ